jgi:hypothetical protein
MTIDRTPLNTITLQSGDATPRDIILRALPVALVAGTSIFLYAFDATPTTIILHNLSAAEGAGPSFPTQYAGLRYYHGTVKELCLVATADAPSGNQWLIRKGATTYAVYLVDTSDPNASAVRVKTSAGIKAARLKT